MNSIFVQYINLILDFKEHFEKYIFFIIRFTAYKYSLRRFMRLHAYFYILYAIPISI